MRKPGPRKPHPTARRLLAVTTVGLGLATLVGYMGGLWWVLDLVAHFRLQLLICLVLLALAALVGRTPRYALLAAVLAIPNAISIAPSFIRDGADPVGTDWQMSVMALNVHTGNTRYDAVAGYIRAKNPDVVVLAEVDASWAAALTLRLPDYSYGLWEPRPDNFGIAVIAKRPFAHIQALAVTRDSAPSILATLSHPNVGGGATQLLATHPPPPINAEMAAANHASLAAAARLMRTRHGERTIIVGDLNTTPWSDAFNALTDAGFKDSRRGFGHQATWPTWFAPAGIPIDHCLLGPALHAFDREVGPDVGSDHYPIFVRITDG